MTTATRIRRCRVCGILRDGEVCGRCAERGYFILKEVVMHPDGTPLEDRPMDERGPRRIRPRRTQPGDERNAEPRTA